MKFKRVFRGRRYQVIWHYGNSAVADVPTVEQYLKHKEAEIRSLFDLEVDSSCVTN